MKRPGEYSRPHPTLRIPFVPMQPSWVHRSVFESRAPRTIIDLSYQASVGIRLHDPSTIVDLARKRGQDEEEQWSVQEWAEHTSGWTEESQAYARGLLASSPERREEFIAFAHNARDDRNTDRNMYDYYEFLIRMARLSDKALGRLVQSFSPGERETQSSYSSSGSEQSSEGPTMRRKEYDKLSNYERQKFDDEGGIVY